MAEVRGDGAVTLEMAREGLRLFGVDDLGLDKVDRAILSALCERFSGGPVGLSTLAVSIGEEAETVEDVYEPFLLQRGLLMRTPRGRVATRAAWSGLDFAMAWPLVEPTLLCFWLATAITSVKAQWSGGAIVWANDVSGGARGAVRHSRCCAWRCGRRGCSSRARSRRLRRRSSAGGRRHAR